MSEQGYIVEWPIRMYRYLLSGHDALEWLQGQVTNDLRHLTESQPLRCCLVKSTGQLIDTLEIEKSPAGLELLADGTEIESRVQNYVIMEDVSLEALPLRQTDTPQNAQEYSVQTLEQGLAIAKLDSDEKTLPPELGRAFEGTHIAYDKGCYVGQEVLQRIHSRGHVNRLWQVLVVEKTIGKGTEVYGGKNVVGHVTRSGYSQEFGWLAGAMLKTARDEQIFVAGELVSLLDQN